MIDGFLRLSNADGQPIEGESTDHNFANAIQIYEFSLCPSASDVQVALGEIGDDARTTKALAWADVRARMDESMKKANERFEERQRLKEEKQKMMEKRQEAFRSKSKIGASFTDLDAVKKVVADKTAAQTEKAKAQTDDGRLSFKISKDCDSASADLFQAYCSTVFQPNPNKQYRKLGQFKKAEVSLRKMFDVASTTTVPLPYLVATFTDVTIDSYNVAYNSGRFHMTETVVFRFVGYRMQYTPQATTGDTAGTGRITSGTLTKKA